MAIVTRASAPEKLEEGLRVVFGREYARISPQWKKIFTTRTTKKRQERSLLMSGLGLAQVKDEGAATQYDSMGSRYTSEVVMKTYSLGFQITKEAMDDDLYESIEQVAPAALAVSFAQTAEIEAAALFNNGFSTVSADGQFLFDTDKIMTGGTWANRPTTGGQLSEATMEQAYIAIRKYEDDRGNKIALKPKMTIVPVEASFTAKRLFGTSRGRVGGMDNDINTMSGEDYMVWDYLTDTDAFFVTTDCSNGFLHYMREKLTTKSYGDFDSDNYRFKGRTRYAYTNDDPRSIFANPGS